MIVAGSLEAFADLESLSLAGNAIGLRGIDALAVPIIETRTLKSINLSKSAHPPCLSQPRRQQSSQRRPCRFLCMQIAGAAPLRSPPEMIALCWHRRVQQRYGGRRGTNPRRNYGANGTHVHESFRCELAEAFLRPLRRNTSTRSHSHTLVGRSGRQEIASRVRGPLYSRGCWRQRSRACRPSCCRRTRCPRVVAVHFAGRCSVIRLSPFSHSRAISSVTTAPPKSLPCSA